MSRVSSRGASREGFEPVAIAASATWTLHHPCEWDRQDENPARISISRLLADDLVSEVPGQEEQVAGSVVDEALDRLDPQATTGHQLADLVGIAIDDVVQRG